VNLTTPQITTIFKSVALCNSAYLISLNVQLSIT